MCCMMVCWSRLMIDRGRTAYVNWFAAGTWCLPVCCAWFVSWCCSGLGRRFPSWRLNQLNPMWMYRLQRDPLICCCCCYMPMPTVGLKVFELWRFGGQPSTTERPWSWQAPPFNGRQFTSHTQAEARSSSIFHHLFARTVAQDRIPGLFGACENVRSINQVKLYVPRRSTFNDDVSSRKTRPWSRFLRPTHFQTMITRLRMMITWLRLSYGNV